MIYSTVQEITGGNLPSNAFVAPLSDDTCVIWDLLLKGSKMFSECAGYTCGALMAEQTSVAASRQNTYVFP